MTDIGRADEPVTRRYRIEHRTAYRYSDSVSASYGRGYLRPRVLPWQDLQSHTLVIEPAPSDAAESTDVYGNVDSYFHVTKSHTELVVTGVSMVVVRRPEIDVVAAERPWEDARIGEVDAEGMEFLLASPYVQITEEVREYAASSFRPGRPAMDALVDLVRRIHADFKYSSGSTKVGTSVPEILTKRSGVCQDFAHLMVACARSHGLPARYVSGYLATNPPPGRERMVGVDASHAWAAVRVPGGHWLALDPTNDQLADERYTTVAWGRDYGDVPPLRGVIFTDAETSTMKVAVDVAPL
ncbi:transglutaminase-like putative cysteine protease [Nakamurella sp. UYEF19]|uniref:transglutaminase family protein n=1 Tax=Nakamurella sp. UYEF19 TaxID=1756392 RepID=UPI00339962C3